MFTWICPQCGREVPPSYSECPDCASRAKGSGAPAAEQTPAPAAPTQSAPPVAPAPAQPVAAQPPAYVYAQKRGQPGWLVAVLVAVVLVGAGGAAYYFLPSVRAQRQAETGSEVAMETPPVGGAESAAVAHTAKFLEVTGLRIIEENKRAQIKYLVVNHSAADLAAIKGSITLRASNSAEGAAPVAIVPLDLASLGPYEVREITSPLKTTLRAYELPDWQFLRAELQLTSP